MRFKLLSKLVLTLLCCSLFNYTASAQKPVNDSCSKARVIAIGPVGYDIDTFYTDSIAMDSATIQIGEYFHSSMVTSGNDKKSIWFKFYLAARRGVDIELKQNANAIATKDCGFTTYLGDQCLPTSTMATAAKLTTLNQFGSSFHPCMEPGWYMVQVSAKARAMGKVYLQITTSYPYLYPAVVNAEYDAKDSAYDFGDQLVGMPGSHNQYIDYELGCYTVSDSSELYPDIGSNYQEYSQSAWFVFKSNTDHDETQFRFSHKTNCSQSDTMAYRLYKGDARNGGTLQLIDSNYGDWGSTASLSSCYSVCRDIVVDYNCLFDSGEVYSVQLLYHKDLDKEMRFRIVDRTSKYAGYPKPVLGQVNDIGVLSAAQTVKYGFSCESKFDNNGCGNTSSAPINKSNWNFNMNEWITFELSSFTNLNLRLSIADNNNYKNYRTMGFRLYNDTVTTSCTDIDTSSVVLSGFTGYITYSAVCLPPGKYALQLLGVDSVRDYSSYACDGSIHLGGDYAVVLTPSIMPDYNRFALKNVGEADSINKLDALPNFTLVSGERDTVSCFDGVLPLSDCDTLREYRKVMYRTFTIGDSDNDGDLDSGMVYIDYINNAYRGWPYYDYNAWHQLYKGDALALRASQTVSAYPDTLTGLTPVGNCLPQNETQQNYCLEPGTYTFVSRFDDDVITTTEQPRFIFRSANTKFYTYAKAQFVDSIMQYGSVVGEFDTFTCKVNPDTIDGHYTGRRNTYHVFYLDTTAVTTIATNYWYGYYYTSAVFTLFKGDIRNGKSGLKLYNDGADWTNVQSQTATDCKPLKPGWYTVVISNDWDISYDSSNVMMGGTSAQRLSIYPHRISINTRATNIVAPKYYRPSLSAFADSLINNNNPLSFDTNYSTVPGIHLNLKKFEFPLEILECDLDTPLNHFPKSQLCDTATTDIVYYNFNLAKDAYVKILGNPSGRGTWQARLYDFDVRTDSAKLATATPVQTCDYNANFLEFCNLQKGKYSVVYFCKREQGHRATISPTVYIDSVSISRFDHAANAYDFGAIPGDGQFHNGKVGDTHPIDTALAPSHDIITCFTGAQLTDPTNIRCYSRVNELIYKGDTNVALYPYDSANYTYSTGTKYNPYQYNATRNIWYSFTVEGRGNVTLQLNGENSSILANTRNSLRYAIFRSDEDGSLSLASLKSSGKIDSTISDGLTYLANDFNWYCWYQAKETVTFAVDACEKIKPIRYYVMVETMNYNNRPHKPNVNQNVWLNIKYDSLNVPDTKFDYYSTANKINGLNDANLLRNGEFDMNGYWTGTTGNWIFNTNHAESRNGGLVWTYYRPYHTADTAVLYQDVDVSHFAAQIAAGTAKSNLSGYLLMKNETTPDEGRVVLQYLNSSGGVISTHSGSWYTNTASWQNYADVRTIPTGTVKIRIRLESRYKSANNYFDSYFDDFSLKVDVPDRSLNRVLKSDIVYKGEETYFAGATLDSTDVNKTWYHASCSDTAQAGTVWYKVDVDSSGYMHLDYTQYTRTGSPAKWTLSRIYDVNKLRVYRSVINGDSTKGLERVATSTVGNNLLNGLMGGTHQRVCVLPGTYYIQINRCAQGCMIRVQPRIAFDFYPAEPTKHDYYSTASVINDAGGQSNTTFGSDQLYRGDSTYFIGATLDTTDFGRTYYYSYCSDTNYAKTVWYKFTVDSSGYLYYNYEQGGPSTSFGYSSAHIRLYRSTIDGDSLAGLELVPAIRNVYNLNSSFSYQYATQVCVSRGTYYFQLNSCSNFQCVESIRPRLWFDFHAGDYCESAVPIQIDTLAQVKASTLVNCHTIGTDFGEDGSNMGCLYGPDGYKSTWFVVDYTDTAKVDLEFKLAEYTNAKSADIRYRTYYGNCKSLTPGPCNNNALTSFVIDCVRKGTYYVQVVTPNDANGEIEISVEAKENTDTTCNPVDIFQPNAAFYYNTKCPQNVVEFINTSSRGDSIRYHWDFGYLGWTDTALNPVVPYPALAVEKDYDVKLVVEHITRGSRDSIEIKVTVPYTPYARILTNDTILCKGEDVLLTAEISNWKGIWSTGDTTDSITVNSTGMYYYDMLDKPQLLVNPSFYRDPTLYGWTANTGTWTRTSSYLPRDSTYTVYATAPTTTTTGLMSMSQVVDVSYDSIEIDSGVAKTSLTGFILGHNSYEDEGQVILEYLDKNNNLLGIYQSVLTNYGGTNWQYLEHTRTTPKNTRKLKVTLQTNKVNQTTYTSYAFFDKLQLKMRSACSYKDSVFVLVKQLPQVQLPEDTTICVGDSVNIQPVITYHNPYVIKDSFNAALTGSLKRSATHTASDGYITLIPGTSTNETGQIEWEDSSLKISDSFSVSFDYYTPLADRGYDIGFYMFAPATPSHGSYRITSGYSVALHRDRGNYALINWGYSRRITTYPTQHLAAGKWQHVLIKYNNKKFEVYLDGKLILSYTDPSPRTQTGYKFGLGAYGYQNVKYLVKNFQISRDNPEMVDVPTNTTTGFTYTWNDAHTDSMRWARSTATYTLKVEDPFGCVSEPDTATVIQVKQYDSLFTSVEYICEELDSFYLTKPVSTGYFYGHPAVDSSGLVLTSSASSGVNTLYFGVVDTFGCLNRDTSYFVVDSILTLTIDSVGPLCKGASPIQLTVNDTNGYFYGGVYVDSSGNFDPAQTASRSNAVYYRNYGSNCVGADTIYIIVDSIPDASITAAGPFCANAGVQQLTGAINTGGRFTSTSYIDTAGLFDPSAASIGVHSVYYTFTDSNGCIGNDSTTVQVDSVPDASITAAGPFCENASSQQIAVTGDTSGSFTSTGYLSTSGVFDPMVAQTGNHKIFYAVTDGNNCTSTDSVTIQVDSIPDASIASAGPYCANDTTHVMVGAINTGGSFATTTYLTASGVFDPTQASMGNNQVKYTVTDGHGCMNTDSLNVQVDSIPNASITASGPYCANDTIQTLVPAINVGGSFTISTFVTSTGQFDPAHAGAGSHPVYYSFTDGNGCANTDSLTIVVDSIPDASIKPAGPFCINAGVQTLEASTNTGGNFLSTTYLTTAGQFDPITADTGVHRVYYTFTDGNGCANTDSLIIRVDSIPDASIAPAGPYCANDTSHTMVGALNTGGSFTVTSYLTATGVFDPTLASLGGNQVYYSFTDGNGCSNTDSLRIQIDSIPDAAITPAGPYCANDTIQTLVPAVNTSGSFTISSFITSGGQFDPALAGTGNHNVYYSFTDGNGCANTDSITIVVDSIPDASIKPAGPFCSNAGAQTLEADVNTGGSFMSTTYLSTAGQFDPVLADTGTHSVYYMFTDGNGCANTDSVTIRVDSIPDASITPAGPLCENGDSIQLVAQYNVGGTFSGGVYIDSTGWYNPVVSGKGTHSVYYVFIDGNGCVGHDTLLMQVDSFTQVTLSSASPYCEYDTSGMVTATPNLGGQFSGGVFIDTSGNLTPVLAGSGTYTLYFDQTNGAGCETRDSIDIYIDTIPNAAIQTLNPLCANDDSIQLSPELSGGFFYGTAIDSTGWFKPQQSGSGMHTVYYSIQNASGCRNVDSLTINVDTIPDASISTAGPYCANAGLQQLTGAVNTSGTFTTTAYLTATGSFDPFVALPGDHKVYYAFTDGNGCSNTDSLIVHVDSIPDASISNGSPYCMNAGIQTINPAVNSGGVFAVTGYLTAAGDFDPVLSDTGLHTIYYTFTDGEGCVNTDSTLIRVDSIPDASIQPSGPFCENDGIQTVNPGINTGGIFTTTVYLTTTGDFDPSAALRGTHTIYYSFTDGNTCANTDSTTIVVDSIPDASIQPAGPYCANDTAHTLQGAINTGGTFTTTAFLSAGGLFDPTVAAAGNHKVYYAFTDGNGCSNLDSTDIVVDTIPNAALLPAGPFCANASTQTLSPVVSGTGSFATTAYLNATGDFEPNIAGQGAHTVYYNVIDGNGCSALDSLDIQIDSIPNAQIALSGPHCENDGVQTVLPEVAGGSFTVTAYLTSSGQFDPLIAGWGNHTIYYSITDGNGCTGNDSLDIVVDSIPNAAITPAGPFCENDGMQNLTGLHHSAGSFQSTTYLTNSGDFDPAVALAGTHKVYYDVTSANGCGNTDSIDIIVNGVPDASIQPVQPICANGQVINITSNVGGGSFTGGTFVSGTGQFDPQAAGVGLFWVYYSLTNTQGCSNTDSIQVEVLDTPANTLTIQPHEGCEPLEVTFSTEDFGNPDSLHWTLPAEEVINERSVVRTYNTGIHAVRLQVFNQAQCSIQIDSTIEVFPKPIAAFDFNPKVAYMSNPTIRFTDLSTGSVVGWDWDFDDNSNALDQNPVHTYVAGGQFNVQLIASSDKGCLDTTVQIVTILDELLFFVPEAISPNDDGINDVFRLVGSGFAQVKLQIFNRWGERIYESEDFEQWDATYKGEKVPMGSYLYMLEITDTRGRRHYSNGEITVIR